MAEDGTSKPKRKVRPSGWCCGLFSGSGGERERLPLRQESDPSYSYEHDAVAMIIASSYIVAGTSTSGEGDAGQSTPVRFIDERRKSITCADPEALTGSRSVSEALFGGLFLPKIPLFWSTISQTDLRRNLAFGGFRKWTEERMPGGGRTAFYIHTCDLSKKRY